MPHTAAPHKKLKRDAMASKTPLAKLLSCARYFPRAVSPYLDIGTVLFYGSEDLRGKKTTVDACNTITIPDKERREQEKHVKAFKEMFSISPECLEVVREFHKDKNDWAELISRPPVHAKPTQPISSTNSNYVLEDPRQSLVPNIPRTESKSNRGLNHPMLRNAIIPWPIRIQINELTTPTDDSEPTPTPAAKKALKALMKGKTIEKKPALTGASDAWPSCFYAENSFNPDDPENGLFCSQFILRVLRHTWTTPSSAIDGCTKIPKICHANGHGQFKVTPRMLGYACAQARTMISTSEWTEKDGSYKYDKMFDNVLALFEADETDPWAVETLEWLQNGVFGVADDDSDDSGDEEGAESPATRVRNRRAACRAAASSPSSE
ncbi:hypothetical protein R3P38DRAFT_3318280 [Favolaschia claudopus]|uniref:Uncharacterized protein n=1 Tax=Favolaschia claudopus TaxID=2862362 RepID=A0AAW0B6G1_9AGAR